MTPPAGPDPGVAVTPQPEDGRSRAAGLRSGGLLPYLVLALFGAALFLPGLGSHDLWNPDEPRYAEVTREMRATGEWALPHVNGAIYAQKPPLLFWSMHLAATLRGGLDETAARLPSAVAGIVAILAVFALGRLLFDEATAWTAAIAYATCTKVLWQGHVGQIDMLLASLVVLAMLAWVWSERRERTADPGGPARGVWLFYLLCGLATLAKGPVGFLPPLLSILAYQRWTRDRDGVRRLRIGRGFLLWAAIVLLWLVPAGIAGGEEYLRQIVFKQNVQRYADPWHHFAPPWYYLTVLPGDFFPWFWVLPAAVGAWRTADPKRRDALRLAISWVAVTLVFFSISPGKRTVYILTMYPGLALLAGAGIVAAARDAERWRRWFGIPFLAFGALLTAVVAALPRVAERRADALAALPQDLPLRVQLLAGFLAAAFLVAGALALRRRILPACGVVAAAMAAMGIALFTAVLPAVDPVKSFRPMAGAVTRLVPAGETYGTFPQLEAGLLFYSRRTTEVLLDAKEVTAFVAAGHRVVVADRDRLKELAGTGLAPHPAAADLPGDYVLLTTGAPVRAVPPPPPAEGRSAAPPG